MATSGLLRKIPILEAVAFVFLSLYAVTVCPFVLNMQTGGEPVSWPARFVQGLRWYWTLPVGVVLAALTIWIPRSLSETATAIFCAAVSLGAENGTALNYWE